MPEEPICQSCGMPLSRDEEGGGSEKDGSRSSLYCSHCYKDGVFTVPHLTAEQMQERVRGKLTAMSLPNGMVEQMTRQIPGLRRWASS